MSSPDRIGANGSSASKVPAGAPLFRSMKLKVAGGTFEIKVQGPLDGHIECITLNDEPYELPYIMYQDIVSGGTLEFIMK